MSAAGKSSVFAGTDLQFILTFAAGMGAFWLSGQTSSYLPIKLLPHNYLLVAIIGIIAALAVYGLLMAIWATIILGNRRGRKPVIAATVTTVALALISSLILTFTSVAQTHNTTQFALLAFVLYCVYGIYYVIGWALARKLAK